jgi:Flp pilus assembly pilin Flp
MSFIPLIATIIAIILIASMVDILGGLRVALISIQQVLHSKFNR